VQDLDSVGGGEQVQELDSVGGGAAAVLVFISHQCGGGQSREPAKYVLRHTNPFHAAQDTANSGKVSRRPGGLPGCPATLDMAKQIVSGIKYLRSLAVGILHRGLKVHNVLANEDHTSASIWGFDLLAHGEGCGPWARGGKAREGACVGAGCRRCKQRQGKAVPAGRGENSICSAPQRQHRAPPYALQ
jgi:hypothetical protein